MIVNGEAAIVTKRKELWLRCFTDSEEDVDYFLEHRFQNCSSMVAVEDGEVLTRLIKLTELIGL